MSRRPRQRKPLNDPHASREARRYAEPIASREYLLSLLREQAAPMTLEEIAAAIGVKVESEADALPRRLNAMVRSGQIIQNRRAGYMLVDERELRRGRIAANREGFGFLIPDEGDDDIYLSPRQMRQVLHGDRAVVRIVGVDRRDRPEGIIVEVLERANQRIVGRLFKDRGAVFVVPEDRHLHQDILIAEQHLLKAKHQQIVVVELLEQPTMNTQPIGAVIEVLGDKVKPGMEIEIAIKTYDLPCEWPRATINEARQFKPQVSADDCVGRVDIRHLPLITIDGEDARDFDDAVYCEAREQGWRLLVAIADVAHYVNIDSAIDVEAQSRGTSVYFPGRVIPMLPEVLSNQLCSLNPEVDRLCLVCDMHIDKQGEIQRSRFYNAVMYSHARMTYTEVAELLQSKKPKHPRMQELKNLYALYKTLSKARHKRGAIDFDSAEVVFEFDDLGKIAAITPRYRNDAHRLIEECMISANVAAARFLQRHKIGALYRNHEGPTAEKLVNLRSFLQQLNLRLGGGDEPSSLDYARLIERCSKRPDIHVIETVMLRSLAQAVYQPELVGHFGLALEKYAHFTSPIRRYPDLLVHRAIKHILLHKTAEDYGYSGEELRRLGEHCSMTERRADEATRDATQRLKCEYMLARVGETFDGVVSAVTSFGLFVELKTMFVDGLVHITSLPRDYYHFDIASHCLRGERSGRTYRLGDALSVIVAQVNLDDRKIDLTLAETVTQAAAKKSRKPRNKQRQTRAKK